MQLVSDALRTEEIYVSQMEANPIRMSRLSTIRLSIIRGEGRMPGNVEKRRVTDARGQLTEEAEYVDGVLNGKRILWSSAGVKLGEAEYQGGKLHGRSQLWNEAGQLVMDAHYVNGELDGPYLSWWDNGNRKEQGQFRHGSRTGTYRWFNLDDSLHSEQRYNG